MLKKILLIALLFLLSCQTKKNKDEERNILFLALKSYIEGINGDNYAKLYSANNLLFTNTSNTAFLTLAETASGNSNKKLVMIHGWNSADRDDATSPSDSLLKSRILTQLWKDQLGTDFFTLAIAKGYSIYFFTYLTSNSIEKNSSRLKLALDKAFSGEKNTVTIYSHSMGGLITKSAINSGDSSYISKVLAVGTPFHGSPWASSSFQATSSLLGELASFLTNTDGGKGLAWDNYDGSLSSSSNSFLINLAAQKSKDSLITAFYSSIDKSGTGYNGSESSLLVACSALGDRYSPSDCIVPAKSARYENQTLAKTVDLGRFGHTEINLRQTTARLLILAELP
ncbi:MAG: hypothetical protein SFU98_06370 [Leptospiraceae bacterium]|nr:hypothetical protein [Leptospiraceae bacterium]